MLIESLHNSRFCKHHDDDVLRKIFQQIREYIAVGRLIQMKLRSPNVEESTNFSQKTTMERKKTEMEDVRILRGSGPADRFHARPDCRGSVEGEGVVPGPLTPQVRIRV